MYGGIALIALLHTLRRMAPPRVVVDWLKNVGAYFSQKLCTREVFETSEQLEDAVRRGKTNHSRFEGKPAQVEAGVVVLATCPFQETLETWKEKMGDFPQEFEEVIREYEKSGDVAVSIFCIAHQNYRRLCFDLMFVGKKPTRSDYLACKSPITGRMRFHEDNIRESGLVKEKLRKLLEKNICIYKIRVQEDACSATKAEAANFRGKFRESFRKTSLR